MRLSGDADELVAGLQDKAARACLSLGGLVFVGCTGFLAYYFFSFAGQTPENVNQAKQLIDQMSTYGGIAALVAAIGLAVVWWGEEVLSVVLILLSAALYFSPLYMPSLVGGSPQEISVLALKGIQHVGGMLGLVAIAVTMFDLGVRVRARLVHGSKADSLKYGKGVKEDLDRQNVFLGKCWQLPYCRKFVREKCPIYHARRTCWKERVGCMCEEKVIHNAMTGVNIPRDMVAAAKYIPYNTKLPMEVKIQRCRQCVIYNEHQKHKYKVALPSTLLGVVGIWLVAREPLKELVGGVLTGADRLLGQATLSGNRGVTDASHLAVFRELVVVVLMLMVLAYAMKVIEYLFFKAKV